MTTKRRYVFCALYNIQNEHLLKAHGLLLCGMKEYHGYDSFFATYENGSYPNLKYLSGVRMEFIPKRSGNFIIDSCSWLT